MTSIIREQEERGATDKLDACLCQDDCRATEDALARLLGVPYNGVGRLQHPTGGAD